VECFGGGRRESPLKHRAGGASTGRGGGHRRGRTGRGKAGRGEAGQGRARQGKGGPASNQTKI